MKLSPLACVLAALAAPASANDFAPAMTEYLQTEVLNWASNPVVVDAIRAQNTENSNLDQGAIDAMDKAWRSEVGQPNHPTITSVLQNPASDFLRDRVTASGGVISELFVMDMVGLNVAASDVTSDFWQGDEAKFQKTYPMGPGAIHISEVEFDESSQTYQGQVSITITDPDTGQAIGAMTVGLNAEAFL